MQVSVRDESESCAKRDVRDGRPSGRSHSPGYRAGVNRRKLATAGIPHGQTGARPAAEPELLPGVRRRRAPPSAT